MKGMTLVVGGTGKTGRRVVERLEARGVPVRIGSRSAEPPFDWEDQATWVPALRGMESAYVTYYPDLAVPGAAGKVAAFAGLAVKNGVRRLVLLSGRGEAGPCSVSRRCATPAQSGRSCARPGSARTSARVSSWNKCRAVTWRSRPGA